MADAPDLGCAPCRGQSVAIRSIRLIPSLFGALAKKITRINPDSPDSSPKTSRKTFASLLPPLVQTQRMGSPVRLGKVLKTLADFAAFRASFGQIGARYERYWRASRIRTLKYVRDVRDIRGCLVNKGFSPGPQEYEGRGCSGNLNCSGTYSIGPRTAGKRCERGCHPALHSRELGADAGARADAETCH
jgi:hypothetical protein